MKGNQQKSAIVQFLTYFFNVRDQGNNTSFNVKAMHWINRIAILVFLVAIVFYVIKRS